MDRHLAGVAVPIFDHSREVVASLALPGAIERYTAEHTAALATLAQEAGRRISAALGWRAGAGAVPAGRSDQMIRF
jgi:DNA-binding IclR family transcriptional regulator